MSSVLDASALLAVLNEELGAERVTEAIAAGAVISAVNLCEVVTKLTASGMSEAAVRGALSSVAPPVVDFDVELAYRTGLLHALTRRAGLSLGDRACLALAERLDLPALTTDRTWKNLGLPIGTEVIR